MKTSVKELKGNWDLGYVLDKHTISSTYIGDNQYGRPQFDTLRSEAGEALYQLKYKGDWGKIAPLALAISKDIFPRFKNVGLIIPMPPSKQRAKQPVAELASALGKIVSLNVFDNLLSKRAVGKQLKDVVSKEEKIALLKASFSCSDGIQGNGRWNALIVDDLYDTGATLEAACDTLRKYDKINKIYVATVTWV